MTKRYLFVSYARSDLNRALPLVDLVRQELAASTIDVELWMDIANLSPGQSWDGEIAAALRECVGLLVFVSPESMSSGWVGREIGSLLTHDDRLIIPIILEHVPSLPNLLARRQWLDISRDSSKRNLIKASRQIVDATESYLRRDNRSPPVAPANAAALASEIASEVRRPARTSASGEPLKSIFLVHGHDTVALAELKAFLQQRYIKPIVLSSVIGASQSLLQKFFTSAAEARFAVVRVVAVVDGDVFTEIDGIAGAQNGGSSMSGSTSGWRVASL